MTELPHDVTAGLGRRVSADDRATRLRRPADARADHAHACRSGAHRVWHGRAGGWKGDRAMKSSGRAGSARPRRNVAQREPPANALVS